MAERKRKRKEKDKTRQDKEIGFILMCSIDSEPIIYVINKCVVLMAKRERQDG
jgi:hypothetical protein